ncbi:cyclin-like 2, partial [Wolfiporia cocos MD-104 SS10]
MLATALKRIAELNASPAETYAAPSGHPHPSDQHNREHPPIWRTLTTASRHSLSTTSSLAFHARNVPAIALDGYLNRIHKYCPASNEVFVSLLVYLDRMTRMAKEACGRTFPIDMYNIHRLIIAGVTVASKFFSDVFYTNSRYAKVGGLPLAELNQLELQFLLLNDFRLPISVEEMQYF